MPRIELTKRKENAVEYPTYSAKDFFALQTELEEYAIDKELPKLDRTMEMVHFVPVSGIQKWLIKQGALANREDWTVKDIPLYKELQNKLEQYTNWCRRREYAQNQSLQEYSDMATETIVIADDIPF